MQGENPDFVKKIFEAREAISRRNPQVQEGGEGIPSLAAAPTPFTDVNNNGILDSLEVAQATTTPAATTTVPAATTTVPAATTTVPAATTTAATMTTPTPFDYSRWPSYGPAGGPVPNYVNQGLGQGPHFDYWNQIARTFPGMR
jgi:hypothetical protein